jgi:DNA polymerase IV
MKILCVLIPHFPLMCEVRKYPALGGCPAVVTSTVGSQKLVLDHAPALEGLRPGMPLQQALARHDDIKLVQADISHYWTAFNELLDVLEQRSPLVEGAGLGCAYVGLDGMQLIYPDDDAVIKAVREAVPLTFEPRMGIAGGKFPAYLAALHSPLGGYRVLTGDVRDFLKDFSCDVLPVSAKSKDKLHDFGIHTLGQVTALPAGPLHSQFGPEGKIIRELARGHDDTPLYPRMMEEIIEESAALPSVTVSLEAILAAVEALLIRIFSGSRLNGRGIRSLNLWTRSWNAENWERVLQFKEPAMDIKGIVSRTRRALEDYPQPGPVEQVGITIKRLGYPGGRQNSLFSDIRAQDHLAEDIRQLELRQGGPQVYKLKEVEPWSRIPERRYALTPTSQ